MDREQGIGKAGNRRVRTVMVEPAWLWTRYQARSCAILLIPRTSLIDRPACSQNHFGGSRKKATDRSVEIRHRRCCA